jgi:hypothetical protein
MAIGKEASGDETGMLHNDRTQGHRIKEVSERVDDGAIAHQTTCYDDTSSETGMAIGREAVERTSDEVVKLQTIACLWHCAHLFKLTDWYLCKLSL